MQLQTRRPRMDRSLNPDRVQEVEQQLLNLKGALGRSRVSLHTLQDNAAAYSDRDYVQYSQGLATLLADMEGLADLQRSHGTSVLLELHEIQESAARQMLFVGTRESEASLRKNAAAQAQHVLGREWQALERMQQQAKQLTARMKRFAWRYPPTPYISWRFKGTRQGAITPRMRIPGVQQKQPKARRHMQQVQLPGTPPQLLGP